MVLGAAGQLLERGLDARAARPARHPRRALTSRFVRPIPRVGPAARRRGQLLRVRRSASAGTTAATRPAACASAAPSWRSPSRISSARCRPSARTSARVRPESGHEADPVEGRDEPRLLGRDDEVGGERQAHARAGGHAVDRCDHRLRQAPDGLDERVVLGRSRTRRKSRSAIPPRRSAPAQKPRPRR